MRRVAIMVGFLLAAVCAPPSRARAESPSFGRAGQWVLSGSAGARLRSDEDVAAWPWSVGTHELRLSPGAHVFVVDGLALGGGPHVSLGEWDAVMVNETRLTLGMWIGLSGYLPLSPRVGLWPLLTLGLSHTDWDREEGIGFERTMLTGESTDLRVRLSSPLLYTGLQPLLFGIGPTFHYDDEIGGQNSSAYASSLTLGFSTLLGAWF